MGQFPDEEDLVRSLADKNTRRRAFADVVKQYGEQLYWRIRRIVLNHEDANDILQNVFVKAWNNIETFEGKSKLSTWLYSIAINESLDFLRKERNRQSAEVDDMEAVASRLLADDYFDGDRASAMLQAAIATLPDVQRMVFNMRYYDDMKYADISAALGTSEGALKASYHLAVKKITEFFQHND
ncbi:MAG: sigma-70 family RNA polymerase sigma factor [Prevotella sp.]|nr:sigma-70 family RNA polymerase sigma factor [Prevotella sp.]